MANFLIRRGIQWTSKTTNDRRSWNASMVYLRTLMFLLIIMLEAENIAKTFQVLGFLVLILKSDRFYLVFII